MPGISITQQQVKLYMSYRKNQSQVKAAAKAGISSRSARRIDKGEHQTKKIPRQRHTPGDMGISDYTWMNKLKITLAGAEFKHKLYHYRLVYSGWTYVQVILGGESFESLSSGLQNAFWRSGGVPLTHRTDSLSAAYKNHAQETLLTERYEKLCKYYDVKATRNNKGIAHENVHY